VGDGWGGASEDGDGEQWELVGADSERLERRDELDDEGDERGEGIRDGEGVYTPEPAVTRSKSSARIRSGRRALCKASRGSPRVVGGGRLVSTA